MRLIYKFLRSLLLLAIIMAISGSHATVSALSAEQLRIYNLGIKTYAIEEVDCSAVNTPTLPGGATPTGSSPKNIYMLGDSITVGAEDKYKAAFSEKGIESYINAAGGRSWLTAGNPTALTAEGSAKAGKHAIVDDKEKIRSADGIVIALGSNGGLPHNPVAEVIDTLRGQDYNPNAPIWWVNVSTIRGLENLGDFNRTLDQEATAKNFRVVNWAKAVNPAGDPYVMPTTNAAGYIGEKDNVHPVESGEVALVGLVTDALAQGTAGAPASVAGGTCQCSASSGTGSPTLRGGTNPEIMFNYYVDKGLTPEQAAGITGNAMAESGPDIDPAIVSPSGYRGIFQWDKSIRWPRLEQWAREKSKDPLLLETQMEFAWEEATGRGNIDGIKEQSTVALAAWYWGRFFEVAIIGGSTSETPLTNVQVLDKRTKYAEDVFASFGGNVGTGGGGTATTGGPAVVALDPGHGAEVPEYADPVTKLRDRETTNSPEREDVQDVAGRVKALLEQDGYSVVLLKQGAADKVSKRERVDAAKAAGASLVISIHTTPPVEDGEINEVWPQRVGKFRENVGDKVRVTFDNQETADLSDKYAKAIAEERTKSEGHTVDTDPDQSTQNAAFGKSRGLPAWGDISLVQLWSPDIPWVYNEITQNSGTSIDEARKQAYADGIANGVKKSLPKTGAGGGTGCDTANVGGGDLATTIKAYAWPDQRNTGEPNAREMMPAYREAVSKAQAEGRYVGGLAYPGVDCGGFVTLALTDSGYEPRYNYDGKGGNTESQLAWVRENWQRLGRGNEISTGQLQLGDVAFLVKSDGSNDGHTFVYVGQIDGFNGIVASAGLQNRAPSANGGWDDRNITKANYEWYRKK